MKFLSALHLGNELDNSVQWKKAQIVGNALATLVFSFFSVLLALGHNFNFNVNESFLQYILTSIVFFGNIIITTVTTKKVGVKT